ncbi:hypothetical protein FRB94_009955 [Tulasnella sp. JGI-2019a]|nr:hypothetical protein FRB94_009955 [Tulasnella sp. JGI-2019a]
MANPTIYDEAAFIAHYGDLAIALEHFKVVRYTTVGCATIAALGTLCLLPREFRLIWSRRFTLTRFLLLLNQVLTLLVLCAHAHIFTMDRNARRTLLAVVRLPVLIALSTAFMALYANGRNKLLAKAPIPGPWFRGCFPLLTRQDSSSAVWSTGLAVQCLGTITVVYMTIRTWHASDSYSFLAIAQRNGIFYFMAITFSTIFAQTFFSIAPLSLILASPPIPISIYSIFGSLLLINLLEQQNSPLDSQGELSTILYRAEIERAGLKSKGGKDLELGVLNAFGLLKKVHHTPESDATLSLSPYVTVTSRLHLASHDAETQSPMDTSLPTMAASERVSTNHLCAQQTIVEEEPLSRPALATLSARTSNSNLGRHHFSEGLPKTGRIETSQQQIDDWATLDQALAEEYDEDGKRQRPRRMHERNWKSDELVIVTPPTFPPAVAPGLRLADPNFGSPRHTTMLPRSPWAFSSNIVTSLSSLTKPPRQRFSVFLHQRHPSQEFDPASTPVPTPVFEEVNVSPNSGPVSLPTSDSPPQSFHRLPSIRQSSQSDAARTRGLRATSGGPRPLSSTGAYPRGEGDAATISSVSTGWAFENNDTRDAPDFGG